MLPSHYAPRVGVVLATRETLPQEVESRLARGMRVVVLAPTGVGLPAAARRMDVPEDAEGLARVLYAQLRSADDLPVDVALVQMPGEAGLGSAVLDRLARAAAPRS
jgi:L-threonylcarbamoyladenylate synthase